LTFISNKCTFSQYNSSLISRCNDFDCSHDDLNDFFINDTKDWHDQLLGKTYCFILDEEPKTIICAFSVSNDSIKKHLLPRSRATRISKRFPRQKRISSFPSVLIGRLGVNKDFRFIKGEQETTGDQLMKFIKSWFRSDRNKTGCRFVVVDSYNEPKAIDYYVRNGFEFLFTTEQQEREYTKVIEGRELRTRLMFFDLILLKK
jgi:hypothetical protein